MSKIVYSFVDQQGIYTGFGHSWIGDGDSIVQKILISHIGPVWVYTGKGGGWCGRQADHIKWFYFGANEKGNGYLEDANEVEFAEFELDKDIIEKVVGNLLLKMKI